MSSMRLPHLNLAKHLRAKRQSAFRRPWRLALWIGLLAAALALAYVGLLTAGFFAVKLHITDVPGIVDPQSEAFNDLAKSLTTIPADQLYLPGSVDREEELRKLITTQDDCQLSVVRMTYPKNAKLITDTRSAGAAHDTIAKMLFAVRLRSLADTAMMAAFDRCISDPKISPSFAAVVHTENAFPWVNREEWQVAQAAFTKDRQVIDQAANTAGVGSRMLVATGFVEQMRLYFTEREFYEKFFRPLKILGSATQFAWGVMAIKEATAIDVERHLVSPSSAYYLGPTKAQALDFTTADQPKERFDRLTNEHDHLYSYLYGGFELAQFQAQWQRAGWPINTRPEILATLYNIGFSRSKPSAHPQVGGSTIRIADTDYTFGSLAFEFYYSGELLDVYPFAGVKP